MPIAIHLALPPYLYHIRTRDFSYSLSVNPEFSYVPAPFVADVQLNVVLNEIGKGTAWSPPPIPVFVNHWQMN